MAQIRVMMATWFQGTINEFIEPNKKATNAFRALHFLGGMSIEIKGKRAIIASQGSNVATRPPT